MTKSEINCKEVDFFFGNFSQESRAFPFSCDWKENIKVDYNGKRQFQRLKTDDLSLDWSWHFADVSVPLWKMRNLIVWNSLFVWFLCHGALASSIDQSDVKYLTGRRVLRLCVHDYVNLKANKRMATEKIMRKEDNIKHFPFTFHNVNSSGIFNWKFTWHRTTAQRLYFI